MSLDSYNGVRSQIIDEGTPPAGLDVSRKSCFIFGTAEAGPKNTVIRPTSENVKSIFGSVSADASFDTSLVRGYYEFINACKGKPDVGLIRVGNVSKARVDLYENTAHLSGDLSYGLVDGHPAYAMYLEAIPDGAAYNKTKVLVTEDESGQPNYFKLELPDGSKLSYNLSPNVNAAGVVSKVSDLVNLINNNALASGKIKAGFYPLETTVELAITDLGSGQIERTYDLGPSGGLQNESWGDKLLLIKRAWQAKDVAELIDSGELVAELEIAPEKSLELGTVSIDQFIRVSELETVLTVTPPFVGQSSLVRNLYCKSVTGWDNSYDIRGNVTHGWTFKLYVKRNGSASYTELTLGTHYSISQTAGTVTILEAVSLGDVYYASYRYEVSYSEAKLKSNLLEGDARSYFISGKSITFGAEQPAKVYAYFNAKVYFTETDIEITDATTSTIEFANAANLPDPSLPVYLTIWFEPELPAATGKVLEGSVIQPGALSGGSDGKNMTKKEYAAAVVEAMKAVDLYPRRQVIVMGMYLDDVESGYNDETGLPENKAVNMHTSILPYIERASNLTGECDVSIPVRPLGTLTQANINDWIERLTVNSDTDLTRPANLIDAINNFRAQSPLGTFIGSIAEINGGQRYFLNPACVYAGYKQGMSSKISAVNDFVPGIVKDLGVKIYNAETIGLLNEKRYTTAIVNFKDQKVWADAPTLAIAGRSQFDRQFVRDTVYIAVELVREECEKYIGKPRLPEFMVGMKKDASKALNLLVPDLLSDFFVELVPVQDGYITGRTKLRLSLLTAKEIRGVDIETSISLVQ